MTRLIHLVGSICFDSAEEVFATVARTLGTRAPRYSDGETGERHYFVRWQGQVFELHDQFEVPAETSGSGRRGRFRLRDGADVAALEFGALGYARAAIDSYLVFARMKRDGVIPAVTRFMVALPTPTAVLTSFLAPACAIHTEPAYERAMRDELAQILAQIPHGELALQWDVAHEVLAHDGALSLHYEDVFEGTMARLQRLSAAVPPSVELGFHLCYGDPGHKHIQEPRDTGTAVLFANELCARIARVVHWIHLPVPRDRDDPAYFAPLSQLALQPGTQLYLGLVHHTDGVEGTRRRMAVASDVVSNYGIATECGFGRRDPATMQSLLELHAALAAES